MALCRRAVALLLLLSLFAPARADEPSPEAKRHVELGVQHYEAGRYAQAVKEFELAYRLSNRPAILFNIARAEAKLGHEEEAIAFLRRYLEEAPNAPDAQAVRAEVEARQQTLEATRARAAAEAEAEAARKRAEALAAQAEEERRALKEAEARAQEAEEKRRRAARAQPARNAGYALVSVGPVLLLVGVALGVVAIQNANEISAAAAAGREFADVADLEQQGRNAALGGFVFDALGAGLAVTGAALLGWSFKVSPREKKQAALELSPLGLGARF